jgi:hypothetical protein
MPSHWAFWHLSLKLWAKEGPGVKLAVWLPTTKSRESTSFRRPIWVCDMALERSRRGLQLWLRPRRDPTLQSGVIAVQSSGSPARTISGQFRDSISGVPGICAIWMRPPRGVAEYTIGSMVVAYSRVRAVVCLVVRSARGLSQHQRVSGKWTNHSGGLFWCRFKLDQLSLLPSLIPGLPTQPSTPF